jgi:hypothetical protein
MMKYGIFFPDSGYLTLSKLERIIRFSFMFFSIWRLQIWLGFNICFVLDGVRVHIKYLGSTLENQLIFILHNLNNLINGFILDEYNITCCFQTC